jgi:hypothetical protein
VSEKQRDDVEIDAELISILDDGAPDDLINVDEPEELNDVVSPLENEDPTLEVQGPPLIEREDPLDDLIEEPALVPVTTITPPKAELMTEEENADLGIKQLLSKFGNTVEQIIENQDADRKQIDDAIQFLEGVIKDANNNNKKLSPVYIDAWTRLMQSKADVNANASKVLDSVAKLISAGKGNELIIKNDNITSGSLDLEALLEQEKYEDER